MDDAIVFDSDPSVGPRQKQPCPLRATTQSQPQALSVESQPRRNVRRFSGSIHLARGRAPKRREQNFGFYSHAHAPLSVTRDDDDSEVALFV